MTLRDFLPQALGLALAALILCSMMFMLDHEVRGFSDLLRLENAPAFLLFGAPLWALMAVQLMALKRGSLWIFGLAAGLTAAAVGGLLWISFSHAPSDFAQLRNFIFLVTVAGLMVSGSVVVVERLSRKSPTGNPSLPG